MPQALGCGVKATGRTEDKNPLSAATDSHTCTIKLVLLLAENGAVVNDDADRSDVWSIQAATYRGLKDVAAASLKNSANPKIVGGRHLCHPSKLHKRA